MSKHTPGPWKLRLGTGIQYDYIIETKDGACVAAYPHYSGDTKQVTKANARLMAAATDLLAVVQELEESAAYWGEYDVPCGIVDRMRAAIVKAVGRAA